MIIDPAYPADFTLWASMRQRVMRMAPECIGPRIDEALKDSARAFFKQSRVWRSAKGTTLLTTVADTTDYSYTPPDQAKVIQVMEAWNGTEALTPLEPDEIMGQTPGETSDEVGIGVRLGNKLYITQPPATAGLVIKGVLAYGPADDAVGIPSLAWVEWADAIAAGAAWFVVQDVNKPWSNPRLAPSLIMTFNLGAAEASMSAGRVTGRPLRSRAV